MTNEIETQCIYESPEPACQICGDTGELPTPSPFVYDPCSCQTVVVTTYDPREGGCRYTTRKIKRKAKREWPQLDVEREVEVAPDGTETVIYDRASDPVRLAYLRSLVGA